MKLTLRTRYAIRALYDLAIQAGAGADRVDEAGLRPAESVAGGGGNPLRVPASDWPAQAKEIADRQGIPFKFLEQILQDLRRAKLVEARRGPHGGYALARPAAEISMADILRAVRGPLEDLLGVGGESAGDDIPALVWGEVGGRLIEVLRKTTLADFVARAEAAGVRRAVAPATMYFI